MTSRDLARSGHPRHDVGDEGPGCAEVVGRALAVICAGIERAIPLTIRDGGACDKRGPDRLVSLAQATKKAATGAAFPRWSESLPQMLFISTLRSLSKSSSICSWVMISGGESAMMSPVVRIKRPSL